MRIVSIILILSAIFLGCSAGPDCRPDQEFMDNYQNCLLVILQHQNNAFMDKITEEETTEAAKAFDCLEKITGHESRVNREPPFFYQNDSLLIADISNWLEWYKNASCEFKADPYGHLGLTDKNGFFPRKIFE